MLAIVVLMLAYLTPQIVSLGRALDFVPRTAAAGHVALLGAARGVHIARDDQAAGRGLGRLLDRTLVTIRRNRGAR
jgi:hypothetical protein